MVEGVRGKTRLPVEGREREHEGSCTVQEASGRECQLADAALAKIRCFHNASAQIAMNSVGG